ncbi:P26A [Choristoneura occidentalis alphabaculovirus]|nr:P26A [Choristoneura occidentalis alphabaculovirus]
MAMLKTFLLICVSSAALSVNVTTINNVLYTVNDTQKTIAVKQVDDKPAFIQVIPPQSFTKNQEELDMLHHFPGVASNVMFPRIANNTKLTVLLNNGSLATITVDRVYTNFHSHKNRMVYGQLYSFALSNFSLANQIYIGAPIFEKERMVSVITARHEDYKNKLVIYPVTGISARGLVSGQINFDLQILTQKLLEGSSVYGKMQLPYKALKDYAISTNRNKNLFKGLPRNVAVFYNERDITIALVEGEFEIDRIRLSGPLILRNNKQQ